jgi:phosphoglycolate phosphatase
MRTGLIRILTFYPRYGGWVLRRLVLFDVDGTLVRAGPVGAAVFDTALEAVLGRPPERQIKMSGKTDPQIALEYLELMHADPDCLPEVLAHLEKGLAAAADQLVRDGTALPGSRDLLELLHADNEVLSSVLTGNIAPNAAVKLAAFDLDRWLDLEVGAYGSDDADRRVLVPVALRRVAERHGVRLEPDDVWVVGDTPRDLECARAGGARCVLVATGRYRLEELEGLGADAVLPSLTPVQQTAALLIS